MQKKVFQEKTKILANKKLAQDYFKLSLLSMRIPIAAVPGQFVQIRVSDAPFPFLRRPLGIHRIGSKRFEVLCKVVGRGTEILSQRKPGGYLDIIGPLGNGFDLKPKTYNLRPILVAGGMGVAPLVFLAEKLLNRKILILLGAKTKSEILCEGEFRRLGCKVEVSTDEGSKGFKGKVTELLRGLLSTMNNELSTIYACGPRPMLKEIATISKEHNIPAQVSLEEHMACGIGACLGCVVNTKEGFQRVCKEGPVFDSEEIIW